MHDSNTNGKHISLEVKLNILQDTDKHVGTHISLMKQLGLSVSTLKQ
jgi:hypothetical protein